MHKSTTQSLLITKEVKVSDEKWWVFNHVTLVLHPLPYSTYLKAQAAVSPACIEDYWVVYNGSADLYTVFELKGGTRICNVKVDGRIGR